MAKPREPMRRRREDLGHTQESFAETLGVPLTTYRDWERGVTSPRVGHRPRLARHLQITAVELGRWLDPDGREKAPNPFDVNGWLGHFASLEQSSSAVWTYEPIVVPGLLQTAGYATEVERCTTRPISEGEIGRKVDRRLARQEVLAREPEPLRLSAVIDESILYRVAGNEDVMAAQLDRLVVDAQRPNVDLRVLQFAIGEFGPFFGSFTLLTPPGASAPFMACTVDRMGPHYLDREAEVASHMELFSHLADVALSPGESIELICTVTQERYR
jgi:DNA-binding XRE family transcriptional regulator